MLQLSRHVHPQPTAPVISSRDRRTLEVRQVYPLPEGDAEASSQYTLDVYLFFNPSFGIGPENWNRSVFYRNAQSFMRLHAPDLDLAQLRELSVEANPLAQLWQRLPTLLESESPDGASMVVLARMFGTELTDALHRELAQLREPMRQGDVPSGELATRLELACGQGLAALAALNKVRKRAIAYRGVAHPDLGASLDFAGEYAITVFMECLAGLGLVLDDEGRLRDGSGNAVRMRQTIAATLEALSRLGKAFGLRSPNDDPENYAYRVGLLKKELQRSLYVDTHKLGNDPFVKNSAAMVAAGLAATWAAVAQVPMLNARWASLDGLLVIGGFVLAYVLKDRIKEWVKTTLARRWLPWDHSRDLAGEGLASVGLGSFSGTSCERVRWISPERAPAEVRDLRFARRTVRGASVALERTLHYERQLSFAGGTTGMPTSYGLLEIVRISLADVLRRLDDPKDPTPFFDRLRGRFVTRKLPKVYHLNLVHAITDHDGGEQVLGRTRVVLNRKGILRIEPVDSRVTVADLG